MLISITYYYYCHDALKYDFYNEPHAVDASACAADAQIHAADAQIHAADVQAQSIQRTGHFYQVDFYFWNFTHP